MSGQKASHEARADGHWRKSPRRADLFHEFAERYFPGAAPDGIVDKKTATLHAGLIAGRYTVSRRFEDNFLSLLNILGETKVIDNGDGTIGVSAVVSPSGVPVPWREIAPFLWRDQSGKDLLAARVEGGGVVRFSFDEVSPPKCTTGRRGRRPGGWWLPALAAGLATLLLSSLAWPVTALTRRYYGVAYALTGLDAKAHRRMRSACIAAVLLFLGWVTLVITKSTALDLSSKMNGWVALLRILSPFVFAGAAAVGLWSAWVVVRSHRNRWAKLWAVLLAASLLVLLWAALVFHLIAFRSGFLA